MTDDFKLPTFNLKLKYYENFIKYTYFSYNITPIIKTTPTTPKGNSLNSDLMLYKSIKRTKKTIYDLSNANNFKYFITLTFDTKELDRYNYEIIYKKTRTYFSHYQQRQDKNFKMLLIPEQHKDGAWHFHGLISDVPRETLTQINDKVKKLKKLPYPVYSLTNFKLGYTTATTIKDTNKCNNYILKYITKDLCTRFNKRRFIQIGLIKPKEENYLMQPKQKQKILEDLIKKSSYQKTIQLNTKQDEYNPHQKYLIYFDIQN